MDISVFEALPADYYFRLVLIGDSGVGKSSVLKRFKDDSFNEHSSSTVGVACLKRTITLEGKTINVEIWDTAGQERFQCVTANYYRGAHGVIFVYDLTSPNSFANIPKWFAELESVSEGPVQKLLIGNKADIHSKLVKFEQGQALAQEHGIPFLEVSAKTGSNVTAAFDKMIMEIMKNVSPVDVTKIQDDGDRVNVSQESDKFRGYSNYFTGLC